MSWMLLQVYHKISENADYGDVVAHDTLIKFLQLEQSFDRHLHKWPLGHRLGRLLRLHLNNYCTDRTSKNKLGEWYAAQPALQERLKLKPAELGHQDAYRRLMQIVPVRPIRHWNDQRVAAHIFLSILACLVMAVLRHLARQIGLTGGIETLRRLLWRVKRVVSHLHVGELVIPQVSLTGLPEDARRLLERIGVPLPEPAGTAWIAVRLDAEKAAMRP